MPPDEQSATFCRVCTGKFHVRRNRTGKVWLEDFDTVHGDPVDMIAEPDMGHLSDLFAGERPAGL
ncbi:MAG TPA: hypothetical protein PLN94_19710, partial [Thiolinea sp.]|nr:hypothetical protein [Thiolinea sp.]